MKECRRYRRFLRDYSVKFLASQDCQICHLKNENQKSNFCIKFPNSTSSQVSTAAVGLCLSACQLEGIYSSSSSSFNHNHNHLKCYLSVCLSVGRYIYILPRFGRTPRSQLKSWSSSPTTTSPSKTSL